MTWLIFISTIAMSGQKMMVFLGLSIFLVLKFLIFWWFIAAEVARIAFLYQQESFLSYFSFDIHH